jgi:very-short-patch-repair endonuclease
MRTLLLKKNSTKAERIIAEMLKERHIPFKHRIIINGREYDFLVGERLIVEIGNHITAKNKNIEILNLGYDLLDFSNEEIVGSRERIIRKIQKYA